MFRTQKNRERKAVQLLSHENLKTPIAEQYRLIRNNLQFSSVDKEIKSIVVTSPDPGDGKSTTSANLAIVLAQQEKQVLLVDADLRKPSVHYAFKVSNRIGLTTVLAKEMSLSQAIIKSLVPNLDILTCGPIPPNPSELLGSKMMETILEEQKEIYDYIVFDTPPILAVSDAQILANKCDGVLMVIASGKTKRDRAIKAKEFIVKANTLLLGAIVNGVESKQQDFYGHYG